MKLIITENNHPVGVVDHIENMMVDTIGRILRALDYQGRNWYYAPDTFEPHIMED